LKELKLLFDTTGQAKIEAQGLFKETAYYSAGLQTLMGLCVRLAVAETVFEIEKPPLLLDDPFTELDDENLQRAKSLVSLLSQKYQIIYSTCKTERML
jgi:uncharacterized protein YhaN